MKKYPSKISYGLLSIILMVLIGSTIPMLSPPIWLGLLINCLGLLFIAHIYSTTYYLIDERFLVVKSGFVINMKIDIQMVNSIKETSSIISAPALSFDRLEVNWGEYTGIVISPREKHEFIEHLTSINPQIEVRIKK